MLAPLIQFCGIALFLIGFVLLIVGLGPGTGSDVTDLAATIGGAVILIISLFVCSLMNVHPRPEQQNRNDV